MSTNSYNYFLPHSYTQNDFIRLRAQELSRLAATPQPSQTLSPPDGMQQSYNDIYGDERDLDDMLYARHAEITSLMDLMNQRGTNIPALYNQVYKFIQNPSTVSVETYRRMMDTDETLGAAIDFLISCLIARMGEYTHDNDEIAIWVNERLEQIDGGWHSVLKGILQAIWAGFSVGEKVWANTIHGFVVKKVVQMPPGTLLFETERTGELTTDGILQYQRNYNPALFGAGVAYLFGFTAAPQISSNGARPDIYAKLGDYPFPLRSPNIFSYLSIRIPKRKCIHFAWDAGGAAGSPYGKSPLRRVYKHWVLKDTVLQFLAVALDRKGTPLTVWFVDPNATFIDTDKWNGQPIDPSQTIGKRAQTACQQALKNIHNDSTVIMPGKSGQFVDFKQIENHSNANDFIATLNYLDSRMLRGLLIPSLVFSSGDGSGSFALGQEHARTFDKLCDSFLDPLKQVIIQQLVKEMLQYNYPQEAWEKDGFGEFGSRQLSQEERQKEMECISSAIEKGAVDMNDLDDLNRVREVAGFKMRDTPIPQPDPMDMLGEEDGLGGEGEPKPGEKKEPPPGKKE